MGIDLRCISMTLPIAVALIGTVAGGAFGAGQAVGIKHPVLEHSIDPARAAEYEKAVERVMAMSEEEMLSWMPEQRPATFVRCPNCYKGIQVVKAGTVLFVHVPGRIRVALQIRKRPAQSAHRHVMVRR